MFARCPNCQKIHSLSADELRLSLGAFRCVQCATEFDPLTFLVESEKEIETDEAEADPVARATMALKKSGSAKKSKAELEAELLALSEAKDASKFYWNVGSLLAVLLLFAQLVYFEGYDWVQKPAFRVWAEKVCNVLGCRLPAYRNIDDFEVLHRSLTLSADQHYVFTMVFSNQAPFSQPYPNIHLTFLDFDGRPFADRLLSPADYHAEAAATDLIESDAVTQISLEISEPKDGVGGFDFNFVF